MIIQTCAMVENLEKYGVLQSGCMTSDILGKANGIAFKKVRHSDNRQGCRCMENRNIGMILVQMVAGIVMLIKILK